MTMKHRAFASRFNTGAANSISAILAGLMILLVLAGCAPAAATTQAAPASATPLPAATDTVPAPSPTLEVQATAEPAATVTATATVQPTATQPPTATDVPELAVLPDGFNAWCAPQEYAGVQPAGADAPAYANVIAQTGDALKVKIPAAYCAVIYRFNQPVPQGTKLVVYDSSSPFISVPLEPVEGHPEEAWAVVKHDYVVNPPFWEVTYRVAVAGPDGAELWGQPVIFARPEPPHCRFGGLPDPVTMYCLPTDPKELEPRPGVTYPAYYTREPSGN